MAQVIPKLFFAILFFACSSALLAKNIDIRDNVWLISNMVTGNVHWAENFLEIEKLAKEKKWVDASKLAKSLRANPDCEKYYLLNGEPYTIVLDGLNVEYRLRGGLRDETALNITRKFMDQYANIAAGKNYYSYKYISQKYRSKCRNNDAKYVNACCEIVNYDPYDRAQIFVMLSWVKSHPEYFDKALKFFTDLRNRKIYFTPEIDLEIMDSLSSDTRAKFLFVLDWLKRNANIEQDTINKALDLLLKYLPDNNFDDLSLAYGVLVDLSLAQGTNEARLKTTARIIKTRQSIEEKVYKLGKTIKKRNNEKGISGLTASMDKLVADKPELAALKENIAYLWTDEHRQRTDGKLSISQMINVLDQIEELKGRLKDRDDLLDDIDKYKDLLLVPGVPGQLYHLAEKLYWNGQYSKCFNCLSNFFANPLNPDGFTKGAAHFYIGRMYKQLPPRYLKISRQEAIEKALDHLIIVHTFPTCLTYISYSYILAAEILKEMNAPEQAIALCMADVPSLDYSFVKQWRHKDAAMCCLSINDITNSIRHVQEMIRYCDNDKNEDLDYFKARFDFTSSLWKSCATNFFTLLDKNEAINLALSSSSYLRQDLLQDALTHTWPRMEDLPLAISTNRVLNNNINLSSNKHQAEVSNE